MEELVNYLHKKTFLKNRFKVSFLCECDFSFIGSNHFLKEHCHFVASAFFLQKIRKILAMKPGYELLLQIITVKKTLG